MNERELDLAECRAELSEQRAANRRLGLRLGELKQTADARLDELERKSEVIAGLRAELWHVRNGFVAANEALRLATERIAELEAAQDGRTDGEGCKS